MNSWLASLPGEVVGTHVTKAAGLIFRDEGKDQFGISLLLYINANLSNDALRAFGSSLRAVTSRLRGCPGPLLAMWV